MTDLLPVPRFRCLVIEDHDFQRRIAVRVLRLCGAGDVVEARDGAEAIAVLDAGFRPFDILLCDLKMPGMDGLQFIRHVAERRSASSVILASGLDAAILRAAELMARTYGVRLIGTLEKPLSRAKLLPLVLRHFGQSLAPPRVVPEPMPLAAIEAGLDRHEFEPFYQPKVDMRTGALAGVEVLLRWRHPELGLVPPAAFVPAMEASRLITPATYQILDVALAQCRRWLDRALPVPMAVNVSVKSLNDTDLPDRLASATAAAGIDPGFLTIEITETTAMTDLGRSLETLARIRMKGFGLSIDDYGTGFSSMQQLTRIPFTELKIDQAFVTGAAGQEVLQALLETSLAMARRLRLRTVAEGVESSDDWDVVARRGCDFAQGFFVARPMPGDALPGWHRSWLGAPPRPAAAGAAIR